MPVYQCLIVNEVFGPYHKQKDYIWPDQWSCHPERRDNGLTSENGDLVPAISHREIDKILAANDPTPAQYEAFLQRVDISEIDKAKYPDDMISLGKPPTMTTYEMLHILSAAGWQLCSTYTLQYEQFPEDSNDKMPHTIVRYIFQRPKST